MSGFFSLDGVKALEDYSKPKTYNCAQCKRYTLCSSPKLPVFGEGRLGILVLLGEVALAQENNQNKHQGTHFHYLEKRLKAVGISLMKDCYIVNALRCYSTKEEAGEKALSGCNVLLQKDLQRLKPKVILVTEDLAWDVLMTNRMNGSRGDGSLWDYAGSLIPDQELKTWLLPLYSTTLLMEAEAEIVRKRKEYGDHYKGHNRFEPMYTRMLEAIPEVINKPFPTYEYESKVTIANTVEEAISLLHKVMDWPKWAFDYETSGLAWHNPEHFIHSVSFSNGEVSYAMKWYKDDPTFMATIKQLYQNDSIKIAQNMAFERSWSIGRAYQEPKNLIHDPMLMAHVWRNLAPTGLKYCLYREFGILGYDEEIGHFLAPTKDLDKQFGKNAINTIHQAPVRKVLLYVGLDSLFTYWLAKHYLTVMDKEHMMPGYKLLARAERPLTKMHLQGVRIDMPLLQKHKETLEKKIEEQYQIIMADEALQAIWVGGKFNPGSDADLRTLVYKLLKHKPLMFTNKGMPSVDAEALDGFVDQVPILANVLEYKRWYKALGFLQGIEREQWDGIVHAYFSLNNVDSFRSASQKPNLMNIAKHDKAVMNMVRSVFIPHDGKHITSTDFSSLEIRCNGAITGDKNLIAACLGDLDQHSEMAYKLFMLTPEQKTKATRQVSKQQNFRLFYGGSGEQMADATWKMVYGQKQEATFGMDMKAHLLSKGITTYEKWVEHCKATERWLWNELFPDYQKWRKVTYDGYKADGRLYYPNGFTYQGVASRNSLLNGPGQGCGSCVTMQALTYLFEDMEALGLQSKLINQIHDDLLIEAVPEELDTVKKLLYKHMVLKKSDYNPWLGDVPMEAVFGKAPIGKSWAEVEDEGELHG